MTDRSPALDHFEQALAAALARYADDAGGGGDAHAIADAMLEARRKRWFRIGLASVSGVLAAAVLLGVAVGALVEPSPQAGPQPAQSAAPPAQTAPPTQTPQPTQPLGPTPPPTREAPDGCGFPDGTALSYAGRSTTAALDVQEVVGDPLSFDPADIYITRDQVELENGRRARLVCTIFVDHGFVEITIHPEDGGRYSPAPVPTAAEPSGGIARDAAVDAARDAVPDGAEWEVVVAEAGPLGRIMPSWEDRDWLRDLSADLWVWKVILVNGDGSLGADIVIDYVDGSVYGPDRWQP